MNDTFTPLRGNELHRLKAALTDNGNDGGALMMGPDTSFTGTTPSLPTDEAVIAAIKSVPCHY